MDERTHALDVKPVLRADPPLRLLIDTGLLLASERNPDTLLQTTVDAGLRLAGAAFGMFYPQLPVRPQGEQPSGSYKVAGIDPERLRQYPVARVLAALAPALPGDSLVCSADIGSDTRYNLGASLAAVVAPGHFPVRSYLAVPVRSRNGAHLGTLLYGHPQPAVFSAEAEGLVAAVAAQAAAALDNLRLSQRLAEEVAAAELARATQRATERRLRDTLEAAQLGTWHWDAASRAITFDERGAELFGVPPHVPLDRESLRQRAVVSDDLAQSTDDFQAVMQGNVKYNIEYRVLTPEGAQRWVASTGTAVLSEQTGEPVGVTGTVQDITQRKVQEATLRTSEKLAATGRLAATIAHEINNPLEAVTNLIYLAKTDPATPSSIERLLETADGELARVSQIAQQTLGFYRDTTQPVSIDLNELLKAVVDLFGRKLVGKRLNCKLDLEPRLTIRGLQGEIRQVVSNLLVNAIDATTHPGSEIRIRGRHRHRNGHRGVSVVISDRGAGIPHHLRKSLFTPFVTSKQSLGTGLGLWVTQGIVEKHGGTVRFRSRTAHPSGTVFRVYLPESGNSPPFPSPTPGVLQ